MYRSARPGRNALLTIPGIRWYTVGIRHFAPTVYRFRLTATTSLGDGIRCIRCFRNTHLYIYACVQKIKNYTRNARVSVFYHRIPRIPRIPHPWNPYKSTLVAVYGVQTPPYTTVYRPYTFHPDREVIPV